MGRRLAGAGIALLLLIVTAPAAYATDDTWLGSTMVKVLGSPLEVGVGENASVHANLDGSGPSDIFWFDEAGPTFAIFDGATVRTYGVVSSEADKLRVVSLPVASGAGTAGDPWTITSTWEAASPARLRVSEVVRYTEGSQRFHVSYSVENVSGSPLSFRPYFSSELESSFAVPLARSDATVPGSVGMIVPLDGGTRDPNDPIFDGYDFGRATELEPDAATPWVRAVSGAGGGAHGAIAQGQPLPASLPARGRWQPMLAADWGTQSLAPGATYTFGATVHHASALRTLPLVTETDNTQPFTLQVRTDTADGGALANRRLGWIADGYSRELSGTMTTDSAGHAALTWTADGQQYDRVIVWIDTDEDGVWDRDKETTRQSQINWYEGDGSALGSGDTPGSGTNGTDVTATGGGVTGVALGASAQPLPAGTAPTTTTTTTTTSTRAPLRVARLAAASAPTGIRIRGRLSRTPAKRLTIRVTTRSGRVLGRTTARIRAKRFTALVKTRRRATRVVVTLRYAGDAKTKPLTIKRTLRLGR